MKIYKAMQIVEIGVVWG